MFAHGVDPRATLACRGRETFLGPQLEMEGIKALRRNNTRRAAEETKTGQVSIMGKESRRIIEALGESVNE